jgi:hypothetical protein
LLENTQDVPFQVSMVQQFPSPPLAVPQGSHCVVPPPQTPEPLHVSPAVAALPSSQGVPAGLFKVPQVPALHSGAVHEVRVVAPQGTLVAVLACAQVEPPQLSSVHALPSSHWEEKPQIAHVLPVLQSAAHIPSRVQLPLVALLTQTALTSQN